MTIQGTFLLTLNPSNPQYTDLELQFPTLPPALNKWLDAIHKTPIPLECPIVGRSDDRAFALFQSGPIPTNPSALSTIEAYLRSDDTALTKALSPET